MATTDFYARFLDSTVDLAVIHCSLDGIVGDWLGASSRLLGYTPGEALGLSLSDFFTDDDRRRGLDAHEIAVARTQGRSEDDRWHRRKDGTTFWASGVLCLVHAADGAPMGLCKVLRDRTDVRIQLDALENHARHLQRTLDAERDGVRALAHELRNPLMPIMSAVALLQHRDAEQVHEKASRILANQVGVLKRLVDDLGTLGGEGEPRPSGGLDIQSVNLGAVMQELVDSLRGSAGTGDRSISLVLPKTDIWVAADPARLQQMLLNLLNNALKYTSDHGHVDVSASIEADMGVVRIEDDGVGISPDILPKIFELFTREGRQEDIPGHGVGLAVVRELSAAHGGSVEGRSAGHDKGANFTLRIPLARSG